MFPSLEQKLARFEELEAQLQSPDIASDIDRMIELQREHGGLQKVAIPVRAYHELEENLAAAREMAEEETDADAKAYAQAEVDELEAQRETMAAELEELAAAGDAATRGSASSWRSAAGPAATRRRCSPATCGRCTAATANATAGRWKSSTAAPRTSAGSAN